MSERWPADALVRALRGRTVIDAVCDGEGTDDVRLLLDDDRGGYDDTVVAIDAIAVEITEPLALGPRGKLTVAIGGLELWPAHQAEP